MQRVLSILALAGLLFAAGAVSAAPPPLADYGKLPAVEDMTLSPSGDRFAFIAVNGDQRYLYIATTDGHALAQAPTGASKVRAVRWAGEDHVIVITSATREMVGFEEERGEFLSVAVFNLQTRKSVALFTDDSKFLPAALGFHGTAEIDGRWYGYFGAIPREHGGYGTVEDYVNLYRVDLDTGDTVLAAPGTDNGDGWLVGPDGKIIARTLYNRRTGDWQVLAGEIGGKVLLSGNWPFGGASVSRGRTPDTLLVEHQTADADVYQEVPLAGGPAVDVPDGANIESAIEARDTHLWIGNVIRGDRQTAKMFDPAVDARLSKIVGAFPNETVELESYNAGFDTFIVHTSGSYDSGTYYRVDMKTGHADALGYDYPDIPGKDVGVIKMVDWTAQDGMPLRGVLDLPPGRPATNLPVVVLPHGGPEARDYPTFDWWTQAFVSRGYAVFRPNYRGSGDLGVPFRNAGFGQWGRKMETDITDGLAALAKAGVVDPKRACIVGWSYGGYASLAGVTVQNGFYRCAVAGGAVSHPGEMIDQARQGSTTPDERYWEKYMGAKDALSTRLPDITPVTLASRADAPILLIHGRNDTVVPFVQMTEMETALKSAGKPVEVLILPTSDHWLLLEDMRTQMVEASVAFVEKYNPPDPAPPAAVASSASAGR
ncbi:MAG TPA: alpha/beta fold hydrolase [Caulobacteraceae bacterium]|nr:alpha/beta fold hydrolase [Caulobacteraceae bacterium]